jgi:AbrB family looped-hinge helix DNA binding protein
VPSAKVTSKGQITIPRRVREQLGLYPGDQVEFVEDEKGFRLAKRVIDSPFKKYRGYLKHLAGKNPDELVAEMRGE